MDDRCFFTYRTRPDIAAELAPPGLRGTNVASDATSRAALLLDPIYTAPCAGEGRPSLGARVGGSVVCGDQRCDDVGVPVPRKGRRGAVYVVDKVVSDVHRQFQHVFMGSTLRK